jgi:pheromone a factor receptor
MIDTLVRAIRGLAKLREQSRKILSGSGLTREQYVRLLGLAVTETSLTVFITIFNMVTRLVFYKMTDDESWGAVHTKYSFISQFPEEFLTRRDRIMILDMPYFIATLYGLNFFLFFGFGQEQTKAYLRLWDKAVGLFKGKKKSNEV